jgi:hypothetical protein
MVLSHQTAPPAPGDSVAMFRRLTTRVALVAAASLSLAVAFAPAKVRSIELEPVVLLTDQSVTRGENLQCTYQLTGGPSQIHITSEPAGVVSYDGYVNDAYGTISVPTSSTAAAGTVILHLTTTGEETASTATTVTADSTNDNPRR